jgi:hypothetical protein
LGDNDKGNWIGFLVIAAIAAYVYWAGGVKTVWYAMVYKVSIANVHVDPQPGDCDFMHAPLGEKGCHYESLVSAYIGNGQMVGGDDAPKYAHDAKTGSPIISWDNGKTWEVFGGDIPNQKVESVTVVWHKVTD